MGNSAGRKRLYTTTTLMKKLQDVIEVNPNVKITLSKLEKETGIKRHIWNNNEEVKILIDTLNNTSYIPEKINKEFSLPSANDIVNRYYGNKFKLIESVQNLIDIISDIQTGNILEEAFKLKESDYIQKIDNLTMEVKKKDTLIEKLNKEIDNLYLDSENPILRKEKKLKSNLIQINENNMKKLSMNKAEMESLFESLFE